VRRVATIWGVRELRFDWDPRKAAANLQKHRVAFEETQTACLDEEALVAEDPNHSETEDRFILLGSSAGLRVPSVCHCVRESRSLIRIISARRADLHEQKQSLIGPCPFLFAAREPRRGTP
jgi:uncharacterized DUF497 family protein